MAYYSKPNTEHLRQTSQITCSAIQRKIRKDFTTVLQVHVYNIGVLYVYVYNYLHTL